MTAQVICRSGGYSVPMTKGRLEAFSDGVFAVIITIMVLELKAPHGAGWPTCGRCCRRFLTYVLSFVFLGIYWNNHHHMLHASDRINGAVLWANLHLLFWLSLVPFVTGWMGENHFAALPTAVYGAVLLMSGIAYLILEGRLSAPGNRGSPRRSATTSRASLGGPVPRRDSAGLRAPVDRRRDLRLRRADVARARSANRAALRERNDGSNGIAEQREDAENRI